MEIKVRNQFGNEIYFATAAELMDADIREEIHNELAPATEQAFFDDYCEIHRNVYGEEFYLNTANPQY